MQNKPNGFMSEIEVRAQIRSKSPLPCYVFFGEEQYLIKNSLSQLIAGSVDSFEEFNITKFESGAKAQDVYDAVSAFPMMSAKRVVTLCDFAIDKTSQTEFDRILKAVTDMPSTTVFVIWFETVEINPKKPSDRFKKLAKAVNDAGGGVCLFERKSQPEIIKILQSGAAKRKCILETQAARLMTEVCSDDLSTLINETEKLCMYVGDGGTIDSGTVAKVCSRSVEASVYNVAKTLLAGDIGAAYRLLDDLFYMNTDAALIVNILSSAYIDIYRSFAAKSAGKKAADIAKDFGYYSTAFRLNDAERRLRNFDENQLAESLSLIKECDRLVKGSRGDGRTLIEKLFCELMLVMKKG